MSEDDQLARALERRVAELDSDVLLGKNALHDIRWTGTPRERFVFVMSGWTDALTEQRVGSKIAIDADTADLIVARSALLTELAAIDPHVAIGPLDRGSQYWTPTGPAAFTGEPPSHHRFVAPGPQHPATVQPASFGFYTSTGGSDRPSMWRDLLGPGGSYAKPQGRYTWAVNVDQNARIAEIASAADWVEFVSAYPDDNGNVVLPNWTNAAKVLDGVHFTLPVIAAVQAFAVRLGDKVIPPAYWDVETTFWLNWRFSEIRLHETPESGPGGTEAADPRTSRWNRA